ncbi:MULTISPECIES: helix-turn-helix domain-containing protein [Bacillus]|uniref:helix-turn-helix domain-containing protein n=1 Tax=Bacillus TaxID=1386 RepID=UPI00064C520C|nr:MULTISPECIES: helix-turn-helix domain-containing protein [Bacillus]KLV22701.1 DNA-binding protein [Bacillus altitudinis]WLP59864.1 helix-turn-helix domain-containing protein [Bacillus pumilus]
MQKTILTPPEAAEFLGIHKETVYIRCRNKQLPHFRVGKKIYFRVDSLNEWINKQINESVQPSNEEEA